MAPRPLPAASHPTRRQLLAISTLGAAVTMTAASCGGLADVLPGSSSNDSAPASQTGDSASEGLEARAFDESLPYVEFGPASGAPVVDIYEDFLCPHCQVFHTAQSAGLETLVTDGAITLRNHPRPMLDTKSTPPGYSSRAANAAVAAFTQDPVLYFRVSDALYENQPGPEGLTNQELVNLAVDAGADRTMIDQAVSDGVHLDWLRRTVEPEAQGRRIGTPTIYIDGELWTGDPAEPDSLVTQLRG